MMRLPDLGPSMIVYQSPDAMVEDVGKACASAERGAPRAGVGEAARAVLRSRLRGRLHPVHRTHVDRSVVARCGPGAGRAGRAVVGVDELCLAHERGRPGGGLGSDPHVRRHGERRDRRALRARGVRRSGADVRPRVRPRASLSPGPVRARQSRRPRPATVGVGACRQHGDRSGTAHRRIVRRPRGRRPRCGVCRSCSIGPGRRSSAGRSGWTGGSSCRRTSPSATTW